MIDHFVYSAESHWPSWFKHALMSGYFSLSCGTGTLRKYCMYEAGVGPAIKEGDVIYRHKLGIFHETPEEFRLTLQRNEQRQESAQSWY